MIPIIIKCGIIETQLACLIFGTLELIINFNWFLQLNDYQNQLSAELSRVN